MTQILRFYLMVVILSLNLVINMYQRRAAMEQKAAQELSNAQIKGLREQVERIKNQNQRMAEDLVEIRTKLRQSEEIISLYQQQISNTKPQSKNPALKQSKAQIQPYAFKSDNEQYWKQLLELTLSIKLFGKEMEAQIPEKRELFHKKMMSCEKEMISTMKQQMGVLMKNLKDTIQQVQKQVKKQCSDLEQTTNMISQALQMQYGKNYTKFENEAAKQMLEPIRIQSKRMEQMIKSLKQLKSKSEKLQPANSYKAENSFDKTMDTDLEQIIRFVH